MRIFQFVIYRCICLVPVAKYSYALLCECEFLYFIAIFIFFEDGNTYSLEKITKMVNHQVRSHAEITMQKNYEANIVLCIVCIFGDVYLYSPTSIYYSAGRNVFKISKITLELFCWLYEKYLPIGCAIFRNSEIFCFQCPFFLFANTECK